MAKSNLNRPLGTKAAAGRARARTPRTADYKTEIQKQKSWADDIVQLAPIIFGLIIVGSAMAIVAGIVIVVLVLSAIRLDQKVPEFLITAFNQVTNVLIAALSAGIGIFVGKRAHR